MFVSRIVSPLRLWWARLLRRTCPQAGRLHKVENLDPRFGSAKTYERVLIVNEDAELEVLLFTPREIQGARYRYQMNPEETLWPSIPDRLWAWWTARARRPQGKGELS